MDFMVHFTIETGGHYITILPADWSISTSHDPLPSSCHSEKMLRNPSIEVCLKKPSILLPTVCIHGIGLDAANIAQGDDSCKPALGQTFHPQAYNMMQALPRELFVYWHTSMLRIKLMAQEFGCENLQFAYMKFLVCEYSRPSIKSDDIVVGHIQMCQPRSQAVPTSSI